MTAPDFVAILAARFNDQPAFVAATDLVLGTLALDLCPDCDDGLRIEVEAQHDPSCDGARCERLGCPIAVQVQVQCTHPDAPTIGTLLVEATHARQVAAEAGVDVATLVAYGRNVATAETASERTQGYMTRGGLWKDAGAAGLLDALRTVGVER